MKINLIIKGWYEAPKYKNRFEIEWPHPVLPIKGDPIDVRPLINEVECPPELDKYYVVYGL